MRHEDDDMPALNVQHELHDLRREMTLLRGEIGDLLEAWRTAQGLVRVVKLIGTLAIAIAGVVAVVKLAWTTKS